VQWWPWSSRGSHPCADNKQPQVHLRSSRETSVGSRRDSDTQLLSIGQLADRADIPVPAARYYESLGLISSERTSSNQRRYQRGTLRRAAFIAATQRLGLSLAEIAETLARLRDGRDPT
jgi:hypothetical protein